mmetsp:Transcript_53248/g.130483  ORF Transcript_53248/g.130483 Transcript_53248/m.130483 type:complete len:101 (-) Transcript_53248:102-404(-)
MAFQFVSRWDDWIYIFVPACVIALTVMSLLCCFISRRVSVRKERKEEEDVAPEVKAMHGLPRLSSLSNNAGFENAKRMRGRQAEGLPHGVGLRDTEVPMA